VEGDGIFEVGCCVEGLVSGITSASEVMAGYSFPATGCTGINAEVTPVFGGMVVGGFVRLCDTPFGFGVSEGCDIAVDIVDGIGFGCTLKGNVSDSFDSFALRFMSACSTIVNPDVSLVSDCCVADMGDRTRRCRPSGVCK